MELGEFGFLWRQSERECEKRRKISCECSPIIIGVYTRADFSPERLPKIKVTHGLDPNKRSLFYNYLFRGVNVARFYVQYIHAGYEVMVNRAGC